MAVSAPRAASSTHARRQRAATVMMMMLSFLVGTFVSFYIYAGITWTSSHSSAGASFPVDHRTATGSGSGPQHPSEARFERRVQQAVEERIRQMKKEPPSTKERSGECVCSGETVFPQQEFGKYLVDMAKVTKEDFVAVVDPGTPLDPPVHGAKDVLMLYANRDAAPNSVNVSSDNNGGIPRFGMEQAVENCGQLNLILAHPRGSRKQCFAIMPQYESYHIQRWMRVDEDGRGGPFHPLRMVSRGQNEKGGDRFSPPKLETSRKHWVWLRQYLSTLDSLIAELDPILKKVATPNKTVIVMVCNYGQSELLMNFVCSARSRGFDLKHLLVFTTDQETTDIAQGLGLGTFFDRRNFADTPKEEARRYGDKRFVAMMLAKVTCVQIVSMMGYNLLFQDVDVVWFRDPLPYFENPELNQYDVFFQDDGAHSLRYAPYSANSGFYYIRHNELTRHFLSQLLLAGDLIVSTTSHQQALIAVLQEHVSLHGLRAKVLSRDEDEFPGGFHFHRRKDFMKSFFKGNVHPYIFHMSWTLNKENKLLFYRQMGEWFVRDKCIQHTPKDILGEDTADNGSKPALEMACCSAEPIVTCHYRDKPSKIPCKDLPPIDKGRPSFW